MLNRCKSSLKKKVPPKHYVVINCVSSVAANMFTVRQKDKWEKMVFSKKELEIDATNKQGKKIYPPAAASCTVKVKMEQELSRELERRHANIKRRARHATQLVGAQRQQH